MILERLTQRVNDEACKATHKVIESLIQKGGLAHIQQAEKEIGRHGDEISCKCEFCTAHYVYTLYRVNEYRTRKRNGYEKDWPFAPFNTPNSQTLKADKLAILAAFQRGE